MVSINKSYTETKTDNPILVYQNYKAGDIRNFKIDLVDADPSVKRGDLVYKDATALTANWKLVDKAIVTANIASLGVIDCIQYNRNIHNEFNADTDSDGTIDVPNDELKVSVIQGKDLEMYVSEVSIRDTAGVRDVLDFTEHTNAVAKLEAVEYDSAGAVKTFIIK